jgi:SAM-dependent methyltransferase
VSPDESAERGQHAAFGRYRAYYEEGYTEAHALAYDMGGPASERPDSLRGDTIRWLRRLGVEANAQARVLELGSGMGQLHDVHPGYLGLDFSGTALKRGKAQSPRTAFVHGDMQSLPLGSETIDFIFSWAAIEHVPAPEQVLVEVARVLRRGAFAVLAPAWNCRPWTVKRLDVRPYRELSLRERVEKFTIPLRNHLAWRALWSIPPRARRELKAALGRETRFDYQRLFPDFSLDLPHVSDDDAQASMDPHAAIMFYKTRGWRVLSHPDIRSRLLSRHEPVVVQKP